MDKEQKQIKHYKVIKEYGPRKLGQLISLYDVKFAMDRTALELGALEEVSGPLELWQELKLFLEKKYRSPIDESVAKEGAELARQFYLNRMPNYKIEADSKKHNRHYDYNKALKEIRTSVFGE